MTVTASYALVASQRQSDAAAITAGHGVFVTDNGMYEQRFGLNRKPFQAVLSNADFFESAAYTELAESILHALRSDLGVAVLTGPSGIGKTVTLDRLRRELDRDGQAMVLRGGNIQSPDDLLQSLHRRLIPPPGKNVSRDLQSGHVQRWEVLERMQRVCDFWGPTIILLDDAHLANQDVFAELRTLLEEESEGRKLVRLLIAGPLTFEEFLAEPSMSDFAQRIRAHEFLQPLTSSESVTYLQHQIQRVGGDTSSIFEQNAIERIVAAADGVPRCIDMLADESMMSADRSDLSIVDRKSVDNALSRLRHLPHSWNVSLVEADDEVNDAEDYPAESATQSPTAITVQAATHSVASNAVEIGGPASAEVTPVVVDTSSGAGVIEIGGPAPTPAAVTTTSAKEASNQLVSETMNHSISQAGNIGCIEIGGPGDVGATIPQPQTASAVERIAVEGESLIDDAQHIIDSSDEISEDLGSEASVEEFLSDDRDKNDNGGTPPAAPIDFDKVFGAVTIAGGAVAVAKAVVSEGTTPQRPAAAPCESVTSNAVNLERHMILADASDDDSNAYSHSEMEVAQVVVGELEASADVAEAVSLSDYSPWQPAGEWHSTPASPRSFFHSPGHANSKPVFDRYTWCELGRSVTPPPVKRTTSIVTGSELVMWPPVTDQVAPANNIPVQPIDDEYTGLLADLGILMNSTSSTFNSPPSAQPQNTEPSASDTEMGSQSALQLHSPVPEFVNPEESIDNIEQLLNSEEDSSDAAEIIKSNWFGSREDIQASSTVADDSKSNSESETIDSRDMSADTAKGIEGGDSEHTPDPDRTASQQLFTLPIDIQDVEFDPSASFTSEPSDDGRPGMAIDGGSQAEQQTHFESSVVDELSSKADLEESVQDGAENQQVYTPRLLKNARSRVTSVKAGVGGLKRAAGAESLADTSEAAENAVYPEIHTPDVETEEAPASSFSNLFTRLRQLRGR